MPDPFETDVFLWNRVKSLLLTHTQLKYSYYNLMVSIHVRTHLYRSSFFITAICNPHFHKTCHAQVIKGGVHLSELLFSKIELTVLTPVSLVCGFAGMVFAIE